MTRRVSPAELRRLYEQQQLAPAEIAERSGVSGRIVRAWLRRLGIPLRPQPERRGRRLPTAAELRRRYIADGLTITQLARATGWARQRSDSGCRIPASLGGCLAVPAKHPAVRSLSGCTRPKG